MEEFVVRVEWRGVVKRVKFKGGGVEGLRCLWGEDRGGRGGRF